MRDIALPVAQRYSYLYIPSNALHMLYLLALLPCDFWRGELHFTATLLLITGFTWFSMTLPPPCAIPMHGEGNVFFIVLADSKAMPSTIIGYLPPLEACVGINHMCKGLSGHWTVAVVLAPRACCPCCVYIVPPRREYVKSTQNKHIFSKD